jgi:Kef-type K+ transport system membrane component KefB
MGAVASVSAPIAIGYFHRGRRGEYRPEARLLEFASSIDAIPAMILFGLLTTLMARMQITGWLAVDAALAFGLYIGLAAALAFFFAMIIEKQMPVEEQQFFILALLIIASGMSALFGLSPLFMLFVLGIVLTNITTRSEDLYRAMSVLERPVYILFLLLAGAGWTFHVQGVGLFLALLAFYIIVRIAGKIFGMRIGIRAFFPEQHTTPWCGFGLFSQGALALTMVINLRIIYTAKADTGLPQSVTMDQVLTVLLVAIIAIEFLAPMFLRPFVGRIEKGEEPESTG